LQGLRSAARCWRRWLEQLQDAGQPVEQEAQRAVTWLEGWVLGAEGRLPERWSDAGRVAALEAAQLRLQYQRDGHRRAEQLLRAGLEGSPAPSEEWKSAAEGLLIVAIAGQPGRGSEAQTLVAQLRDDSPQRLLDVLRGLDRIAGDSQSNAAQELARLQLELIGQLESARPRLPADAQRELAGMQARALLAGGERPQAAETLSRLAQDHPRQAAVQFAYGRFLLRSDRPEAWRQAVEQWRRIGAASAKQSEVWWEAKYSVAEALLKLGESEKAAQRIEYLLATEKWESAGWKRRFEELLSRCRRAKGPDDAASRFGPGPGAR
jgi:hypothetical protein